MDIKKSVLKKYRKEIWSKFIKAIKDYKLIKKNDKLAICISGGKDSALLAVLFEELKLHNQIKFDLEYIVMDPGYSKKNLTQLKENFKILDIPITIFKTDIFEIVDTHSKEYPCYLCARMRRGHLYNKAKELGCNKIVLGHHFNDVIETIMLNILYTGNYKTMMPKLKSKNFKKMELIRPLYYIKERDIIEWAKNSKLKFLDCACVVSAKKTSSKRYEIKELIETLRKNNKDIEMSIFRSSENVNKDAIIGYIEKGKKKNFIDKY